MLFRSALLDAIARLAAPVEGRRRVIYLGDMINRGPDSVGVLHRWAASPEAHGVDHVDRLMGNHEIMMLLTAIGGPHAHKAETMWLSSRMGGDRLLDQMRGIVGRPDARPDPHLLAARDATSLRWSYDPDGCCELRKVEPLRRALALAPAYVTGQRRDQSPGTRAAIPVVQIDTTFSTPERTLVKFNPLANWSSAKVWQWIREHDVPYNPLHDTGFRSIGCEPCTRATNPGEHEREGRWWWEEATKRECGLHIINLGKE